MVKLNCSSSEGNNVSGMQRSGSEELSEIIELPNIEESFDSGESKNEFVLVDSVDGWAYPPPELTEADFCGYFSDQMLGDAHTVIPSNFDALLWEY
ncbi:hypothetical protein L1049_003439 [Liquidambar formosana]